jgi:hypothetical protein
LSGSYCFEDVFEERTPETTREKVMLCTRTVGEKSRSEESSCVSGKQSRTARNSIITDATARRLSFRHTESRNVFVEYLTVFPSVQQEYAD